jgi:hypothetical protein
MPGPRLSIVVPYRDREEHMRRFVPHVRAYFARDKADAAIDYRVIVVEQEAGGPFNAGLLRNAGFTIGSPDSDYTCFNDVDYLPLWADYSWSDVPAAMVWYGAETRPVAPGESNVILKHDLERFFGGAVIVPNDLFREVNGYSNEFWGWGYEDHDLRERFVDAGIVPGRRRGTFVALSHRNAGHELDGAPNAIGRVNRALFERKRAARDQARDGLSTLAFDVLARTPIPDPPDAERIAAWERVLVRPRLRPGREQIDALAR